MSDHYEEREIKIVEVTYVFDNARHVSYGLRAYYGDGEEHYEFLLSRDNLADLILSMR